ncbi:MAG TPA: PQQ-binding-like beta-propeller repeat protein [Vicinamibacterales bacterium]|nr:PQQ-binding-like beta-propeller repeat protein [Vicinamibacterales bacterium]
MINRYYNGVRRQWTTRCCSAIALTFLAGNALFARSEAPPPAFFPVQSLWTLALNNGITAAPVYSGGVGFFSIDGARLVAYQLTSGTERWIVPANPQSKPAVSDSMVFVAEPDAIRALRQADGSEAWSVPLAEPLAAPLVWDNGWLVAANATGRVMAFRATDGREIWRRELGAAIRATPALAADRVYVAPTDGDLVSMLVTSGEVVWQRRLGGPATSILALDDRVFAGSSDNYFYAVGAKHGEVLWRVRTGGDVIGAAALDDKHVYFVSLDNILRALDRRTGAQIWKRALPVRPTSGPVLVGTSLVVLGLDPTLHVFETKDGKPGTDVKSDSVISAPPAVVLAPSMPNPLLVYVSTDISNISTVIASTRSMEPTVLGPLAPLPNPVKPLPVPSPAPTP